MSTISYDDSLLSEKELILTEQEAIELAHRINASGGIRIYSKKDIKSADDVTAKNTCAVAYKIDEQLRTKEGTVNVVRGYPELYYTELNHYSDDLDVVQAALMGYLSKVGEPTGKYSKSELKLMQKKIEELCSRLSELNPVTSIGGNGYGNK